MFLKANSNVKMKNGSPTEKSKQQPNKIIKLSAVFCLHHKQQKVEGFELLVQKQTSKHIRTGTNPEIRKHPQFFGIFT